MMATIKDGASRFGKVMGSATKIVLLVITGTLCAALFTGHIDAGLFENATMLVLGAYFGKTAVSNSQDG